MIIDCHNYCFPQLDSPQGYKTLEEKMRMIQSEFGGHHQPVWRVRDRALADNSTLIDPATSQLRDVKWTRHLDQLAWEYEGETYTKQHVPPMLHNLESTPEMIIGEMDYTGIDMGILHTYPTLGQFHRLNEYLGDAVNRFPDRLRRLIAVREAAIPGDPDAAIREVENQVKAGGVVGLQFIPGFYYHPTGGVDTGYDEPWDDGGLRPFWQAMASLKIPVYFTLIGGRGSETFKRSWQDSYVAEQRVLMRWMERYPENTVVITHGLPWRAFLDGDRIRYPEAVWDVFKAPQCHLQLLIPIQMAGMWEYPWKQAESAVQECVERVGADRLMWGTDIPMVARFCTYRQTLDQFRVHCEFLIDSQRQAIIGSTAARIMKWAKG